MNTQSSTFPQCSALLLIALATGPSQAEPVVVVNPALASKPSTDEIKAVFLGQATTLPGSGAVQVGLPKEGKLREDFVIAYVGKNEKQYKAIWTQLIFTGRAQAPKQFESEDELKKWVASTPNGVGILDSSKVDASVKVLPTK
ncbi:MULTISPECIES: phosphate ABC transporter substrate-binding protein [Roseateles]|jgi:hypothetical protein|uniref:phosphate ABC transporter substrate-binding protein n=1 Tax=Roseateles TaxID=93681 RepID=UPI0014952280|nr:MULTISPECIES: phosphate ABC transporter substrate-binding protein [Roseateles]WIV98103.1 hypothetical protein K9V56_000945 [Paucibacter aquatile]